MKWYATVVATTIETFEYEDIEADTLEEAEDQARERAINDSNLGAEHAEVLEIGPLRVQP